MLKPIYEKNMGFNSKNRPLWHKKVSIIEKISIYITHLQ